jgi:hypothetical protein
MCVSAACPTLPAIGGQHIPIRTLDRNEARGAFQGGMGDATSRRLANGVRRQLQGNRSAPFLRRVVTFLQKKKQVGSPYRAVGDPLPCVPGQSEIVHDLATFHPALRWPGGRNRSQNRDIDDDRGVFFSVLFEGENCLMPCLLSELANKGRDGGVPASARACRQE